MRNKVSPDGAKALTGGGGRRAVPSHPVVRVPPLQGVGRQLSGGRVHGGGQQSRGLPRELRRAEAQRGGHRGRVGRRGRVGSRVMPVVRGPLVPPRRVGRVPAPDPVLGRVRVCKRSASFP